MKFKLRSTVSLLLSMLIFSVILCMVLTSCNGTDLKNNGDLIHFTDARNYVTRKARLLCDDELHTVFSLPYYYLYFRRLIIVAHFFALVNNIAQVRAY